MSTNKELLAQTMITPEAAKRLGEAFAELMKVDLNTPSFMRVAFEHQKEHPEKSPMQCMRDSVAPYEAARDEAFKKVTDRFSPVTVNSR